jgi:polysaccharide export outer membrane protein
MALWLALCAAGPGCQMCSTEYDAFAIRCGQGAGATFLPGLGGEAVASSAPAGGPPARRPLFAGRLRPTPQGQAPAGEGGSPAEVLRPVPAGTFPSNGTAASAWQPVQRVASEGPALLGAPLASAVQRVSSTVPGDGGAPAPLPVPIATNGGATGTFEELPSPRAVGKSLTGAAPPVVGSMPVGPVAVQGAFPPPGLQVPDAPREFQKRALSAYIIEPPDILIVQVVPGAIPALKNLQPISGTHLVRMDGTIGLGIYGSVFVAGRTLDQARVEVARLLASRFKDLEVDKLVDNIRVDISVYNSKFYYVITDGGGYGEQVIRIPSTGNETVLDALSAIQGLPPQASKKKIWVARATLDSHAGPHVLPVDWCGITQRGEAMTNYQVFPGDRIYVKADGLIRLDSGLGKVLAPVERVLGVTLLGSSVVNSIKNRSGTGGTGAGVFR